MTALTLDAHDIGAGCAVALVPALGGTLGWAVKAHAGSLADEVPVRIGGG